MVIGVVTAWGAASSGPIAVATAFTPLGMGGVLAFAVGILLAAGGRRWPLGPIALVWAAWALVVLTVDGARLGTEALGSPEACTVEVQDRALGGTATGEPAVRNWLACPEDEGFYLVTAENATTVGGQIEVLRTSGDVWPPVPTTRHEVGGAAISVPVAVGGMVLLVLLARGLGRRDRQVDHDR
ncbi:hypothetical protein UA75_04305 [Actinoalloteichus sp. GBA129-24]|uniref:Uncharacterized protein n=2 Tax=Actinoalloteichus TaxID=65496 RepID=A0AAC9PQB6_9PSEU|nr:hypothetical protein [Actinoalloteichus fjordicus]APU12920.1 hypothetical protein UA74_04205 [Actinoalloteichus fjordicus]APU18892.1 hypothetical protein UA75_04305 [Actinoalloteichus sp. GBA129-24]